MGNIVVPKGASVHMLHALKKENGYSIYRYFDI